MYITENSLSLDIFKLYASYDQGIRYIKQLRLRRSQVRDTFPCQHPGTRYIWTFWREPVARHPGNAKTLERTIEPGRNSVSNFVPNSFMMGPSPYCGERYREHQENNDGSLLQNLPLLPHQPSPKKHPIDWHNGVLCVGTASSLPKGAAEG